VNKSLKSVANNFFVLFKILIKLICVYQKVSWEHYKNCWESYGEKKDCMLYWLKLLFCSLLTPVSLCSQKSYSNSTVLSILVGQSSTLKLLLYSNSRLLIKAWIIYEFVKELQFAWIIYKLAILNLWKSWLTVTAIKPTWSDSELKLFPSQIV